MRNLSSRGLARVVVIGVDSRGMGLLRECLGADAILPKMSATYRECMAMIESEHPSVVIAGFDSDFDEAIRLGPIIAGDYPHLQLVAFSEWSDPDRIRSAMRAGYREYIVLPEDSRQLRQAIQDASTLDQDDGDYGRLVTVCGSKGGVGVTSVAINLAAELSPVYRMLCVDLDFSMGDVAAMLDMQPPSHITNLLRNLDRLDERMLSGSVAVHPSKLHVLAQPRELAETEDIRGDDILQLLTACSQSYQYVVLDCGARLDETTLIATSASDLVFLVCTPDVPSIKNAWRRLHLFDRIGIDRDRVRIIVNQFHKTKVTIQDIQDSLEMKVSAILTRDERVMMEAINQGRLVRDINPRSKLAKDFSNLVELLTEAEGEEILSDNSGQGLLGWLFRR